jgi:hypothetical protein
MKKKDFMLVAGILLVHLFLLIYLKFTAWPEMTLWPYLIAKGWLPYQDIAIAHTPLMLIPLSLVYGIFGTGIIQLKIFTWILILGTDVLVFAIAKKLWNIKTAFLSLMAYGLWMMFYDGNGLWFDLALVPLSISLFYFVYQKKYFVSGILWGLMFLTKQTAVWFLVPILLKVVKDLNVLRRPLKGDPCKVVGKFILGALVIFLLFIIALLLFGILPDFYNWAVKFGVFILPKAQGQIQLPDLKNLIVSVSPFLIFIPLIWKTDKKNINLLIWAIVGCLGSYPRFEYFHFQPAIPFLAIASALIFVESKNKSKLIKLFIPIYLIGSVYLFGGYFMRNFKEGVRFYEKDVQDVVSYVKSNTNPGDKIFVMNWWDNVYALSDRLPATDPWVPQLSWYMEVPGIQEKMVENLKTSKPKMILLNPYSGTGLSAYVPQKVYNYVTAYYILKEKVDGIEILVPIKY